jgi:hypothetical protein
MPKQKTGQIAEPIAGDKLYQERARKAFPILVRQAVAGKSIYYSELAEELGIPNPRNLNYVLGSIGRTLENLSAAWKQKIPPIQCLVLNKHTELPGEGIGWFLVKKADFSKLSLARKREIVHAAISHIFAYPRWYDVLAAAGLSPTQASFEELNRKTAREGIGGGESELHRKLKDFIAANPGAIGLPTGTAKGDTEWSLPSGDKLDVSFRTREGWLGVEVKSEISGDTDIARGLYQCVKYAAVMRAQEASENRERTAEAVLVLKGSLPKHLIPLRNILGVSVIENVNYK